MIFSLTDEIAYKLGKFDFSSFYSYVTWKPNKEPFELAYFFNWYIPGGMGGWPLKQVGEDYVTDWENIMASGKLKTDLFKEISHKLSYIRGRLDSYSVSIEENKIEVCYANSYDLRDFLVECLEDVIKDKFMLLPQEEGKMGRSFNRDCPKYHIVKQETIGTTPGTPRVILEADPVIIKYITGK